MWASLLTVVGCMAASVLGHAGNVALLPAHALVNVTTAAGRSFITIRLKNIANDKYLAYDDLVTVHERRVHVMIVGEDLEQYSHVHPGDFPHLNPPADLDAGYFRVAVSFVKSGRYLLRIDADTTDERAITKHVYYDHNEPGLPRMTPYPTYAEHSTPATVTYMYGVDNEFIPGVPERYIATANLKSLEDPNSIDKTKVLYQATLSVDSKKDLVANKEYTFRIHYRRQVPCSAYTVGDQTMAMWGNLCFKDMNALTSILGAPIHIMIIRECLAGTQHVHGYVPAGGSGEEESHMNMRRNSDGGVVIRQLRHTGEHDEMVKTPTPKIFPTADLAFPVSFKIEGRYKVVAVTKDADGERAILTSHTVDVL